jgi:hypothetical protein
MRAQGVPHFPDGPNIPDALTSLPSFKPAIQACRKYVHPGGGPHGGIPASVRLSLLRHAHCMRVHGVSDYPDPTFPSHGPPDTSLPPSISPTSPVFRSAAAACGGG